MNTTDAKIEVDRLRAELDPKAQEFADELVETVVLLAIEHEMPFELCKAAYDFVGTTMQMALDVVNSEE